MRGGRQKQGYTIVEVMIFLAISGLMFVLAAGFINGKQARNEFRQGMNSINDQFKTVINDVSNGLYPSNSNFTCSANGPSGDIVFASTSPAAGSGESGSNKGCIFIGKVVQFGVAGTNNGGYDIFTVVGRQFQPDLTGVNTDALIPPATFNDAKPIAVTGNNTGILDPADPTHTQNLDLTQRRTLQWGLEAYKMFSGTTAIGAVGFFSGFATTTGTTLESGAATPIAVAVTGSALNQIPNPALIEQQIKGLTGVSAATAAANPNITICFRGTGNQFGLLSIGNSDNVEGQKLATRIQISDAEIGVCAT